MAGMMAPPTATGATSGDAPGTTGASGGASASSGATVNTRGFPTDQRAGIFTDRCGYSHEAADDPILAPGKPGQSMHHNFFGNTMTDASSTAETLVGGATTCTTSADSSAYWTPVMYQNGRALTPKTALIYWRQGKALAPAVDAVPEGLQMIAGNETATAPQPLSVIRWTCSATRANPLPGKGSTTPHDCPGTSRIRLIVTFPSCWDGHTLSAVGQTNVVYPTASGCPSSHPVVIPQIVFHVSYPTSSATGLTLSMTPTMRGSTNTEHVDFINGWRQAVISADVTACISTATRCGPVTGPDASPNGPAPGALAKAKARQILRGQARARHQAGN
jgi:hypothetical protein